MTNLATLLFGDGCVEAKPTANGNVVSEPYENTVIAWINRHPPDLPLSQNHCAACGEYIEVYDVHWIYLADGALIHYSGKYDNKCWKRWQEIRRDNANTAFETSKGA